METIATGSQPASRRPDLANLDFSAVKARLAGQRALVLEDRAESFGRMFVALAAAGCRATLARRRAQLFQMASVVRPTLIIFSTRIEPDIAALVHELRQHAETRDCVLIALAEAESKRERRRLLELGCQGCLEMPVDRYLFAIDLVQRTPCLLADAGQSTAARAAGSPSGAVGADSAESAR